MEAPMIVLALALLLLLRAVIWAWSFGAFP